jgi:hypothetical protein
VLWDAAMGFQLARSRALKPKFVFLEAHHRWRYTR